MLETGTADDEVRAGIEEGRASLMWGPRWKCYNEAGPVSAERWKWRWLCELCDGWVGCGAQTRDLWRKRTQRVSTGWSTPPFF